MHPNQLTGHMMQCTLDRNMITNTHRMRTNTSHAHEHTLSLFLTISPKLSAIVPHSQEHLFLIDIREQGLLLLWLVAVQCKLAVNVTVEAPPDQ
jgi:hypothetical protein